MNNNKIIFLQNLINKTLLSSQKYKLYDILGPNELNITVNTLENIYFELEEINEKNSSKIQSIEDDIISVIKNFGTDSLEDLIILLNGEDYINTIKNSVFKDKYDVIKKFVHPINFKIILGKTNNEDNNKKPIQKNKIIDENMICENGLNLECFDLCRTSKTFQTKVYGIKIVVHNYSLNKSYIISCLVDDVILSCLDYKFIKNKINLLNTHCTPETNCNNIYWNKYITSLTLKDILVYNENELLHKYEGIINEIRM